MAVRVEFEPTTAQADQQVTDSKLPAPPNLPSVPPTIARFCTLALQPTKYAISGFHRSLGMKAQTAENSVPFGGMRVRLVFQELLC
jgi:hypothetical protein